MVVWSCKNPEVIYYHYFAPNDTFNFRISYPSSWNQMHFVQFLSTLTQVVTDDVEVEGIQRDSAADAPPNNPIDTYETQYQEIDRGLGPISEEPDTGEREDDFMIQVYDTSDTQLVAAGHIAALHLLTNSYDPQSDSAAEITLSFTTGYQSDSAAVALLNLCPQGDSAAGDDPDEERHRPDAFIYPCSLLDRTVPDPFYHIRAANVRAGISSDAFLDIAHDCAEFQFTTEAACLVSAEVEQLIRAASDRVAVTKCYLANKKTVVETQTDLVTRDELVKHRTEVMASILNELQTWLKFQCFERRPRYGARNIMDCKWVIKWKLEILPDGKTRRVIRARLTLRGFKDQDAANLEKYAGTSQRYSQRLLVSEAANRKWPIVCTDISKAFLQGVTYEELARITGEPLRDVNFYLPPDSVSVLKQLPGYANFDPAREVLKSLKPGTGSVDAPRAFHLKLAKVTREELNFVPSRSDEELLLWYKNGELLAIMCIHVDDLKITAAQWLITKIVSCLESTFGKLIVQWNSFTNCGIRHIQNPTTFEISMDQVGYINALKQMPSATNTNLSVVVDNATFEQFRSLRGAVAYCLLTRADVTVYVVALQRLQEAQVTWRHVKALNVIVRRMQSRPKSLTYRYLGPHTQFVVYTDAAFKKEETTGHALKGKAIVRIAYTTSTDKLCHLKVPVAAHLVEFLTKRVRNVTRSTYSAELFSLCDACDHAMLLRQIVHEFRHGPLSAAGARDLREGSQKSDVLLGILIDAMSVYASVTANHIKIPAEKSLLSHLQFVRELLDRGILSILGWTDTRDMLADAMTKGAVDRDRIELALDGYLRMDYEAKVWKPRIIKSIDAEEH